jgi:hypothetical protein
LKKRHCSLAIKARDSPCRWWQKRTQEREGITEKPLEKHRTEGLRGREKEKPRRAENKK